MKRFLALFAVMAMIVSMFSGVVFAALENGNEYTLNLSSNQVAKTSSSNITLTVAVASGANALATDLDGYSVRVYDDTGSVVSGVTEQAISTDSATLAGSEIATLAPGTYNVKISDVPGSETITEASGVQTVDLDGDGVGTDTVDVTVAVLTVYDASVNNINAGSKTSQVVGNIDTGTGSDVTFANITSLSIKDASDNYQLLTPATRIFAKMDVNDNVVDIVGTDTIVDISNSDQITNLYIDTVAFLSATFGSGGTVLDYLEQVEENESGTLDLRMMVNGIPDPIYFTYSLIPLEIELTEDMYYFDEDGSIIKISGKIMNKLTEATFDFDDDDLVIYKDAGSNDRIFDTNDDDETANGTETGYVVEVNNGRFDINFVSSNGDNGIEFFWLYMDSDYVQTSGNYFFPYSGADNFVLTPEFELDTDLDFDFPFDDNLELTGVFINDDNDFEKGGGALAVADIVIAYLDENNEYLMAAPASIDPEDQPVKAVMATDSTFAFLDSGDYFKMSGDIGLFFRDVRVMKGEITPGELTVDFGPDSLPNKLEAQEMTLSFDLGSDYFDDDKDLLEPEYQLVLKIEDEDEIDQPLGSAMTQFGDSSVPVVNAALSGYVVLVNDTDASNKREFTEPSDQEVVVELPVDGWERGDYTAYVKLYDASVGTVIQETSFEFEIDKPAAYNLVGWSLDEIGVGKTTFSFKNAADQKIIVKDEDGIELDYLEVVFNGSGLDDEDFATPKYDDDGKDDFEINVKETGTITVKIHVYEDENDDTPDKTFTEEIKVTGWNVEINPEEILVNSEADVVFVITDEDGDPVNNAVIVIDDKTLVDSAKDNVIGGVYTYEVDEDVFEFDTVGELDVEFYKGSKETANLEVTLEGGIEVLGEEIYSVEAVEITSMVNGLEETLLISVLDDNGDIVFPTYYRIDVDSDGDESSPEEIPSSDLDAFKDVDGVAGKEAREITLLPDGSQQAIIIRATTDDGEKMGEVRIEVQKPQLVMEMGQILTENFKNELEFTVIDPRDNSILEQDLYLKAKTDYVHYTVEDAEGDEVPVDTEGKSEMITFDDDMYKFEIFVNDIDWEEAEDDEEDVEISLYIELDEEVKITDLAIEKPSLTSDPETIVMDTGTVLTLTYLDANGKPLVDYDIELDDDEVGVTDENGQVVYSASSASSVSLTFKAETDDTDADDSNIPTTDKGDDRTMTELKVRSSADTLPPVVTYEVNGTTAIITITDNVRILKAFVDGVEVDMFFPMPTATHVVTGLKIGDNNIQVLASDTKNNILDTTLVITIEPMAEPVEFTIGEETTYGTPVLMSDITMVPVRFAQDLGATVEWDNDTQTVTYTLGEIKVAMTIGSTTAIVNDSNVQLAVAPYKNELGRTMVPLRMIAQELGFTVEWTSNDAPITIK